MTTAFVAGATGYTGRAVVAELRARGLAVVAHVRPDARQLGEWRSRFEGLGARVDTTPWEPGAMATTLAALRPDLVFGLLGTTRERGRGTGDTYETVDYGLTVQLLAAAAGCGTRPRFVYLSAAGAREGGGNAYLAVRGRVERAVRESGLPFTIARPSFITGPDRDEFRLGERVAAAATDLALGVVGLLGGRRVRDRYRSTTNAVLARALVRLALDPAAANRVMESEELR
jgi:nucleoside-diphosphate-sugar epimerase